MTLPASIPPLEQALDELRPIIGRLFSAFDYATGEARATVAQKGYDGSYFSHQVRFEAKIDLKANGIDAEDSELENTPNTGICISTAKYSIRVLRSQDGEIPDPGESERRKRFLHQESEQIEMFGEDETCGEQPPKQEPVDIVILWEDLNHFFSGFWIICPAGIGKYHFKSWLPRPALGYGNEWLPPAPEVPPAPDDLVGITKKDLTITKTGSDDVVKQ